MSTAPNTPIAPLATLAPTASIAPIDLEPDAAAFHRRVLATLESAGVPVLVGGGYAFAIYTGIQRYTKDLDLFLRRADYERAAQALASEGYATERTFPHWLGKAHAGPLFIDLIFDSGNGAVPVDDAWFEHAAEAEVLGVHARVMPVEEMIWSKSFVMERERYDGADVAHLLHACAHALDWRRLLARIGPHWRVLLSHLVLFGFIYPAEQGRIPAWVLEQLLARLRAEIHAPPPSDRVCRGTLLSREQYLVDVEQRGYTDARLAPLGTLTAEGIAAWTEAIGERR